MTPSRLVINVCRGHAVLGLLDNVLLAVAITVIDLIVG